MLILLQSRWGVGCWQNLQSGSDSWLTCSTRRRGPSTPCPWPPESSLAWHLEGPDPRLASTTSCSMVSSTPCSASLLRIEFLLPLLPRPSPPAWRKEGREGEVCLGGEGSICGIWGIWASPLFWTPLCLSGDLKDFHTLPHFFFILKPAKLKSSLQNHLFVWKGSDSK